jgi:acyl-CoA hydrolase
MVTSFKMKEKRFIMSYEKGTKSVEDSKTETIHCPQYEDINGFGRLFGGRLMEWIDTAAGVCAIRHSGLVVTTAAVDHLEFKSGAYLGDIVVIVAKVVYVGRSSMDIRVDTYVEDKETGMRRPINRAYLTEVCIDKDGKPVPVPYGIQLSNESERAEFEIAKKRRENKRNQI